LFRNVALFILMALGLSCSSPADVLIYEGRTALKLMALGQKQSLPFTEIFLVDPDTKMTITVELRPSERPKRYVVPAQREMAIFTVAGANGVSYTIIPDAQQGVMAAPTGGFSIHKGANRLLEIGGGKSRLAPESMTTTLRVAGTEGRVKFAGSASGTLTLNQMLTTRANDVGETLEQALERVRTHLANYGYLQQ
jgi:hypothetical protein